MHISLAGFLHSHRHLLLFQFWLELHFIQLNLHLHLYDTWLVNILDIFVPVIVLNTFRFKYSVLFGTHILLDRSLRVLQIPVHLTTQQPFNYHLSWWRRLEDVFRLRLQKMSLQDVLIKTNIFVLVIRLQGFLKKLSKHLPDVLQKRLQDIFRAYHKLNFSC